MASLRDETLMTGDWQKTRDTFRHGNLPEALIAAALKRLEAEGEESLSLRELARDAGVNHRAVYRHFPDKAALVARVAEEGWRQLGRRMIDQTGAKMHGADLLVAAGVAFFQFGRDNPNLFQLMGGPRLNADGRFQALEAAMIETLQIFARGFHEAGTDPKDVRARTTLYVAALQGITMQALHGRLRIAQKLAKSFVAETCAMLVKGLR